MNTLWSDWKLIVSTVKEHKQFKNYTLAYGIGILKPHEVKIMEDANLIPNARPFAFFAKEESM